MIIGKVTAVLATALTLIGVGVPTAVAESHRITVAKAAPVTPVTHPKGADVGVLFTSAGTTTHSCSASVVTTTAGDVIATAAHCLSGTGAGAVFAPGWVDGTAPYGTWVVQRSYVESGWLTSQDPADDLAFLVVAPTGSNHTSVQAAVGSQPLGTTPSAGTTVTVTGYATGTGGSPITCTAAVTTTSGGATFDCDGFVGGTSGGSWITSAGTLVGVIGGVHQGGCLEQVSYTSQFTTATAALLQRATSTTTGDTLPTPGSDGC